MSLRSQVVVLLFLFLFLSLSCTHNRSTHSCELDVSALNIRYEPFLAVPLIRPDVRGIDAMHNVTSLWGPSVEELEVILQKGSTPSIYDPAWVRILVSRDGVPVYEVDAFGTVRHQGRSHRLSSAELDELLVWIYTHTPVPDLPSASLRR